MSWLEHVEASGTLLRCQRIMTYHDSHASWLLHIRLPGLPRGFFAGKCRLVGWLNGRLWEALWRVSTALRLHQCRVTPTVFEVRICVHLRRLEMYPGLWQCQFQELKGKLTRLDSNSKSLEAAHSMQCFLAKKMNLPKLHKNIFWYLLSALGWLRFWKCVFPPGPELPLHPCCLVAAMVRSVRWVFPPSVESISILSDALSREKLGSCYPGHERNIWICQTLAESNNAWVRGKFPAAFCTRQHQCCALVVVAAFESLGCHGYHSTMSDSKSLEQSVRGDAHRFWWYHPGATHLQWVSLHWTASLKLKMKLTRASCIQQLNQVCKQIVSWCVSDVYWNTDRSLHTTTPHHTSRLHRMLPGHSLDWGRKGRSSGHVQPQGSTVTLTLGRAAVNCVNTLAALPELQVVEVLVLSRKSSLAP